MVEQINNNKKKKKKKKYKQQDNEKNKHKVLEQISGWGFSSSYHLPQEATQQGAQEIGITATSCASQSLRNNNTSLDAIDVFVSPTTRMTRSLPRHNVT